MIPVWRSASSGAIVNLTHGMSDDEVALALAPVVTDTTIIIPSVSGKKLIVTYSSPWASFDDFVMVVYYSMMIAITESYWYKGHPEIFGNLPDDVRMLVRSIARERGVSVDRFPYKNDMYYPLEALELL